jgi:hypothetical protein
MAGRTNEDICNLALLYSGVNQKIGSLTEAGNKAAQACNTIFDEKRSNLISAFRWPFAVKRKQLTPYSGAVYAAATAYGLSELVQFGNNVYRSLLAANTGHQPDLDASAAWWAQVTRDGYAYVCPLPADCVDPIAVWEKLTISSSAAPPIWMFGTDQTGANLRNPRSSGRVPMAIENANDGSDNLVLLTDLDAPVLKYTADVINPAVFPTEFVEALAWEMSGDLARGLRGDEKKGDSCDKKAKVKLAEAYVISMRENQEDVEPISEFEAARQGSA